MSEVSPSQVRVVRRRSQVLMILGRSGPSRVGGAATTMALVEIKVVDFSTRQKG